MCVIVKTKRRRKEGRQTAFLSVVGHQEKRYDLLKWLDNEVFVSGTCGGGLAVTAGGPDDAAIILQAASRHFESSGRHGLAIVGSFLPMSLVSGERRKISSFTKPHVKQKRYLSP